MALTGVAKNILEKASEGKPVNIHIGTIFSTDSILGEFFRLDALRHEHGCIAIDMETAASFKAAALAGIRATGMLQISDVLPLKKSLFSGRSEHENQFRQEVKRTILAKAALDLLVQDSADREDAHQSPALDVGAAARSPRQ